MRMQMPTMLIVIKGHLPLRFAPPLHCFCLHLFASRSLSVCISRCQSQSTFLCAHFTFNCHFPALVTSGQKKKADCGTFALLLTGATGTCSQTRAQMCLLSPHLIRSGLYILLFWSKSPRSSLAELGPRTALGSVGLMSG